MSDDKRFRISVLQYRCTCRAFSIVPWCMQHRPRHEPRYLIHDRLDEWPDRVEESLSQAFNMIEAVSR